MPMYLFCCPQVLLSLPALETLYSQGLALYYMLALSRPFVRGWALFAAQGRRRQLFAPDVGKMLGFSSKEQVSVGRTETVRLNFSRERHACVSLVP